MDRPSKVWVVLGLLLAMLPALVSAEPPAPKGKLVFEDNFDSTTKSGLEDNLTATDFSRGFHPPGVYHLKVVKNNQTQWVLFPNRSFSNVTLLTDIGDFSDDTKSGTVMQGIVFRAQDANHLYAVLLNSRAGMYTIRKLDGANKWTDLVAAKASSLIKSRSDVNTLRVDADGKSFTIYLNGEELDTFEDASYAKGGIGFIIANSDAKEPHMHFDNVKIYTTDAQPAALPNTSTGSTEPWWLLAMLIVLLMGAGVYVRRLAR